MAWDSSGGSDTYEWNGHAWETVSSSGAAYVADVGVPSLRGNRYISDVVAEAITALSVASPTDVTVASTNYSDQDGVILTGTNSTPVADGYYLATKVSATDFTVPVNVTVAGTTGVAAFIKSMTFTQAENIRAYRLLAVRTGGSSTDYVKVAEDAVNMIQAAYLLQTPSASTSGDVQNNRIDDGVWTEWQELSKDTSDLSLSSLHFAATGGSWEIWMEGR